MATLRQLLTKAFEIRGENWPIVDLDNINVYCPVEERPDPKDKYITLYDSHDEPVATFPLDKDMKNSGLWTKGREEFHYISVNVLRPQGLL